MPLVQTIEGCLETSIDGAGLLKASLDHYVERLRPRLAELRDEAVKDKNLRTLIERFTGGLPKLPTPTPAPDAAQPADANAPADTGSTKPN